MSEVEKQLRHEKGQIQELAFRIFALVGFLSSIVTIISWINSTQASLSAIITQNTVEMPADLQLSKLSSENYSIDNAISDLKDRYCNPVAVDYSGSKSRNYLYSAEKCEASRAIFESLLKAVKLDGKKLLVWDITLANDGKNVAENVTVRSAVPVSIRAMDADNNPLSVGDERNEKVFTLPNLNPRDKIQIRLTSSTPVPEEYDPVIAQPRITYSGGIANNRKFIVVSGRYSDIAKFLDDLPTIFQILVIVGVSTIIALMWMVPVGMLMDANERRKKAAAKSTED